MSALLTWASTMSRATGEQATLHARRVTADPLCGLPMVNTLIMHRYVLLRHMDHDESRAHLAASCGF